MKNLNEEINRIKSLFNEERLYGNIINESAGGRFGWLNELLGAVDDVHVGKGFKKWQNFSMSYKNADEFLGIIKKNPDYVKLINEDYPTYVRKIIDDIVKNGVITKTTPDLLSNGYMKSILNTFKRNGADLTKQIEFDGIKKSVSEHIQEAWSNSTQKQMIDDLQSQITKRIESESIWGVDVDVNKLFADVVSEYSDEIKLLKTSDGADDIIRKTIDMVNGVKISKNIKNVEVMKKIANVAAKKISSEDIGMAHAEYISMFKDFKIKYSNRLNKLIGGDINPKRAIFTTDNPIVTRLAKIKAWEHTRFTEDRIIRLLGDFEDSRLIPIFNKEGLTDMFVMGHAKSLHYFFKKTVAGNKLLKDTKNMYKIALYGYALAQNSMILYVLRDLINVVNNLVFGGTTPTEYIYSDMDTYIFNFGGVLSPECYELKGYDSGESIENIPTEKGSKNKKDYIFWFKQQRKNLKDEEWFPEDFCNYFICEGVEPVTVDCGKYAPLTGEKGSLSKDYQLQREIGNSLDDIEAYVTDTLINTKIPDQVDKIKEFVQEKSETVTDGIINSDLFENLSEEQQIAVLEALKKETLTVNESLNEDI